MSLLKILSEREEDQAARMCKDLQRKEHITRAIKTASYAAQNIKGITTHQKFSGKGQDPLLYLSLGESK